MDGQSAHPTAVDAVAARLCHNPPVIHPPLPRFHGAWGLLGAALVPGLVLAPDGLRVVPLAAAILLGFAALGSLERGAVSPRARRHLPAWVAAYLLASLILLWFARASVLARPASFLLPALAGALLATLRLVPPLPILRRPAAREALGMGLLGLALPALLITGGAAPRPAAALYLLYAGFFAIRLAFVRAHIAGRATRAVQFTAPLAASAAAAVAWAVAILGLGLDPWLVAALLPVLGTGFLRLARDRRAERAIRTLGLEELASVAAFAAIVSLLGGRTLAG
jgi:hypothetical protein